MFVSKRNSPRCELRTGNAKFKQARIFKCLGMRHQNPKNIEMPKGHVQKRSFKKPENYFRNNEKSAEMLHNI